MRKLSTIITEIIGAQPFLEEAIYYGFLNLTAFAEYIRPYIEKELQKTVSVHAIKMAISRLRSDTGMSVSIRDRGFSNISTRKNLSILTLVRTPKNIETVTQFMIEHRKADAGFFTIIEGMHEIDIVCEYTYIPAIQERFSSHSQLLCISGLGLISCALSDTEISTPGLFYSVSKRLAFHDINIIQILSTYHELGIIVEEGEMKRALSVLMD